jgi:hypothetical protein
MPNEAVETSEQNQQADKPPLTSDEITEGLRHGVRRRQIEDLAARLFISRYMRAIERQHFAEEAEHAFAAAAAFVALCESKQ